MPGLLEQLAGVALIGVVLADVFLNVLYARAGITVIAKPLAHRVRWVFVTAARFCGPARSRLLSFCGPAIVVALLVPWVVLMVVGAAMIIQPELGGAIRSETGPTSRGFISAIYVAAGVISSAGAGTVSPHGPLSRLFFAFCAFLGISVMTLVITYLMQLYMALQRRDELALKVELMTGQTGDAARLVTALGPEGRFDTGYSVIADLAVELGRVKEAHHLYPVLFYFRFPQPFYELSRFTLVILDAAALIRTALTDADAGWLKRSAAFEHLERAGLVLIDTLHHIYLGGAGEGPEEPQPGEAAAWRARFMAAVALFRAAGAPTRRDVVRGADDYVRLRNLWNEPLMRLGGALGHRPEEIDAALHQIPPPRRTREAERPVLH